MNKTLLILAFVLLGVLVIILSRGVLGMGKGGVEGARKANMIMRARIAIQFLVVLVLLAAWWVGE